jgi:translation elongation factor EF-G
LSIDPYKVDALVPLAKMFGYETSLARLTETRGMFDLVFDRYAVVSGPSGDDGPFAPAVGMRA